MVDFDEAKGIVERVRRDIEVSMGTRIWDDYVNALKLISQVIFTRSSGFIFELIQNAEDAGLGLEDTGLFEIRVNQSRVKMMHNGRAFTKGNVEALCGIRSSKKPENGTLGYLGIGFKSVFRVTDCPEIYSNGFQFKFDRNHEEWVDPNNTPWHVLPIWIEQPSETIDPLMTTFIIPFRKGEEETHYSSLLQQVTELGTELYLFLRWLKRIEITDEVSGQTWTLENLGENKDDITILRHNGQEQRLKLFRRILTDIPNWVRQDRLTQEYRANVTQREIAIAFALDDKGNLAPQQARAMYGGVYSFLPLGEARSGAKFAIQADFLVQPGREAINYEAKWNHWLVEQVASLCVEAIDYFKKHDKWKYQFLPAFEFTKSKGLESYDRLFGPKLIEPLEKLLEQDDCVPTADGGWARPGQVVRLLEDEKATEDLVTMGILKRDEIATVLGDQAGLKLVAPEVKERDTVPFRKIDRRNLLENKAFLERKCQEPEAAGWFRPLYVWLQKHPVWDVHHAYNHYWVNQKEYRTRWQTLDGRTYKAQVERYHKFEFVLTAGVRLLSGGDVWIPDLPPSDPVLRDLADTLQKSRPVLHPDILGSARDAVEQKTIRGFLTGLTGVQVLDSRSVCKEALLPRILTTTPKPSQEDLLKYSTYCQQILGNDIGRDSELWVLTKKGDIRAARETLLPKEFQPERDWETSQKYVPGLNFLSSDYLAGATDEDRLIEWRLFFSAGGVKDSPDNGVEVFAENFAREKLEAGYTKVIKVDKLNYGYDLEAESKAGEKIRIEVKGKTDDQNAALTSNETDAADKYGNSFYLCVVYSVPESPNIYMVRNPVQVVKAIKIILPIEIPSSIWKASKWHP